MINQIANTIGNMVIGGGSAWDSASQQPYSNPHYQQALHGLAPGIRANNPVKWMFDGTAMSLTDFADAVFGEDDAAKTMFLLKYR